MTVLYHSFKSGTISDSPLTLGATAVNSAGLSALPVVAAPDTCWLVFDPAGTAGTPEIVQVTTHTASATVCTIVRGQQTSTGGSVARQHAAGTQWVLAPTPSDLAFLLNQVLTTKGDLATFSTAPTRFAAGTNGQYLKADSTQATGLAWSNESRLMGSSTLASDFTSSTTSLVDTGLTVTFTAVTGRTYLAEFIGVVTINNSSVTTNYYITETSQQRFANMLGVVVEKTVNVRYLFTGTGSKTVKVQMQNNTAFASTLKGGGIYTPLLTVLDVT